MWFGRVAVEPALLKHTSRTSTTSVVHRSCVPRSKAGVDPPHPPRGQSTVPAPLILSFPRLAKQCPKYTPRRPPRLSLSPCPQCQLWSQHPTNFTLLLLAATVPPFSLPFSGRRKQQHRSWTGPAQPTMLPRSSAAAPRCQSRRHSYAHALV